MERPIFNTGQIEYLGNLYQAISDCSAENLKGLLRTCIKRPGLVLSGDTFAAYIDGGEIIVPIGSVVFEDFSIYSPLAPTTLTMDLDASSIDKYLAVEGIYTETLPYPIMSTPGSISAEGYHNTLSVPIIKIVLLDTPNPSLSQEILGKISYEDGVYTYEDMRNESSMLLADPPHNITSAPIISSLELGVFQLPDLSGASPAAMPDVGVVETYINASWLIPSAVSELQYFTVVAVPYKDSVEKWEMATSCQYIPTAEELETLGPRPRAYANLRCAPGVQYKVMLYGYFNRFNLNSFLLASQTFITTPVSAEPADLAVIISNLTTTNKSFQITPSYDGPGKMQVFVKDPSLIGDIVDKRFLYYDGPVAQVVYTSDTNSNIKVRIVDSYARVTHESNTLLHEVATAGWTTPDEEQWVFIVPCTGSPLVAVSSMTVAEFKAPCNFQLTKVVYYLERDLEYDFSAFADIDVTINGSVKLSSATVVSPSSYDSVWGYEEQSAPLPSYSEGDTITVGVAEASVGTPITPYYGTIILYIKKVL